ncbi:colicin E3/pyocin S6 family cytotoxin [Brenneria roseae]|uniref:colicin E3/pyocin S6 family cytotoxin n=1 Tax=Brenneria roseae TaxID=1509241 RepID=UPI001FFB2DD6|nr:colicin E3/pyocin S6 family cytotoxin [Brenneria roseae]
MSEAHKYHTPPKGNPPLPAFPDAKRSPRKTPIQGGGGLRARWKDSDGKIYEWDSQHGTVEVYDRSGRTHLGEFDPVTGEQTKSADSRRRVEK